MKKPIFLLLAAMLVTAMLIAAMLPASAESAEKTALARVTMFATMDAEGNLESADGASLTLYDDLSCLIILYGMELPGTYTENGTGDGYIITLNETGDRIPCYTDPFSDMMALDAGDGTMMIFRPMPDLPAAVTAEGLSAFDGSWECTCVYTGMAALAPEEISENDWAFLFGTKGDFTVTVENGLVTLFGREPAEFAFENGVLFLPGAVETLDQRITLCEGDQLCYSSIGNQFYCVKKAD